MSDNLSVAQLAAPTTITKLPRYVGELADKGI